MVATKTDHWVVVATNLAHPSGLSGALNASSRLVAVAQDRTVEWQQSQNAVTRPQSAAGPGALQNMPRSRDLAAALDPGLTRAPISFPLAGRSQTAARHPIPTKIH